MRKAISRLPLLAMTVMVAFMTLSADRLNAQAMVAEPQTMTTEQMAQCICQYVSDFLNDPMHDAKQLAAGIKYCMAEAGVSTINATFNCDGKTVKLKVGGTGADATTSGSQDVVIAIGGDAAEGGTTDGGNATATNTGGGIAVAVGGNGGDNGANPGDGGSGTATSNGATGNANAAGGMGGKGTNTGGNGGNATANGSLSGQAMGGNGGDPANDSGTGGNGGNCSSSAGGNSNGASGGQGGAGMHGTGGMSNTRSGTPGSSSQRGGSAMNMAGC